MEIVKKKWRVTKKDVDEFNSHSVQDNSSDTEEENEEVSLPEKIMKKIILKAEKKFHEYCSQLITLGFNSSKYDLNLVKQSMAKIFNFQCSAKFTVKKNNSYVCLSTDLFKFLDVTQYLAPGHDYSSFLKSFHVQESKGYFPYEWFDNVNKLHYPSLPSYEAFYSTLKGNNVLHLEYIQWLKSGGKTVPKTGKEKYSDLLKLWQDRNMVCFRDYLEFYNNLDVKPFCTAINKMLEFYKERQIDLLKTTVSIPGVARQLLFNASQKYGAQFALFDKSSKDLYETFKKNLCGGPSIVFKRYFEKNKTKIRNKTKSCKSVLGYDCNSLYLWALSQEMPTGPMVRRKESEGFRPVKTDKYMSMFDWLTWVSMTEKINIKHKMNNSKEVRLGPYPIDGFCAETQTFFQFDGCFWHPHKNCLLYRKKDKEGDKKWQSIRQERKKQTDLRNKYILDQGFKLRIMKECDWNLLKKSNSKIRNHINERYPTFLRKYPGKVNQAKILRSVQNGEFFGCLEVDIRVPDKWGTIIPHGTNLTPYEYFEEMAPIFCNVDVPHDKIGFFMQNHAEKFRLGDKPRRLLVGGMSAKKIFLASPLLQWYLNYGLQVSRVYQCVEFVPKKCFKEFEEQVTSARRLGDTNSECSLLASTMKLIGNSAFGSMIMDKTKHQNIKYVLGKNNACRLANKREFRKLTELADDMYEVELFKKEIVMDLPTQIGFQILQLAKLRMLQFYYSFLNVYCSRDDWEMIQMDTDSCYIGTSQLSLRELIKPEKIEEFDSQIFYNCCNNNVNSENSWLPRECCSCHAKYDSRTPGLFKLEFKGDNAVALCSKTYVIHCSHSNVSKFSCKGVNKLKVRQPFELMKGVLETQRPEFVVNRGFRAYHNSVYTYTQEKKGFNYFYCKRVVQPDGINTKPLDIELTPW